MAGKGKANAKKNHLSQLDRNQFNMKIVTSDVCEVCKQQCKRGIAYMDKMSGQGAIGFGVPCVLTRGKAYK